MMPSSWTRQTQLGQRPCSSPRCALHCLCSCHKLTTVFVLQPFFQDMHRALRPGGVICTQGECMWLHLDLIQQVATMCREVRPQHGFHAASSNAAAVTCRCLSAAPFHTPTPAFRRTPVAKSASCCAPRPATPLSLPRRIARRQSLVRSCVAYPTDCPPDTAPGRPKAAALLQLADPQRCVCVAGVCARRACCQPDIVICVHTLADSRNVSAWWVRVPRTDRSGARGGAGGGTEYMEAFTASLSSERVRATCSGLESLARTAAHGTVALRMQTPGLRATPLRRCCAPGARRTRAARSRVSIVCAAPSKPDSVYACPLPEAPARAEDPAVYACLLPEAPSPGAQPTANARFGTRCRFPSLMARVQQCRAGNSGGGEGRRWCLLLQLPRCRAHLPRGLQMQTCSR